MAGRGLRNYAVEFLFVVSLRVDLRPEGKLELRPMQEK